MRAGQMDQSLVHADQHTILFHSQAEKVRVRNLLMSEEPAAEGSREGRPAGAEGPITIARML